MYTIIMSIALIGSLCFAEQKIHIENTSLTQPAYARYFVNDQAKHITISPNTYKELGPFSDISSVRNISYQMGVPHDNDEEWGIYDLWGLTREYSQTPFTAKQYMVTDDTLKQCKRETDKDVYIIITEADDQHTYNAYGYTTPIPVTRHPYKVSCTKQKKTPAYSDEKHKKLTKTIDQMLHAQRTLLSKHTQLSNHNIYIITQYTQSGSDAAWQLILQKICAIAKQLLPDSKTYKTVKDKTSPDEYTTDLEKHIAQRLHHLVQFAAEHQNTNSKQKDEEQQEKA